MQAASVDKVERRGGTEGAPTVLRAPVNLSPPFHIFEWILPLQLYLLNLSSKNAHVHKFTS